MLRATVGLALATGLCATIVRFALFDGFWEDEFYSVAFVNQQLPEFFIAVARFDPHPPAYYLQLKFWGAVLTSDRGLLLNSVLWHLISCATIFAVGRAWLGTTTGLLAAATYSIVPQAVWASVTLRPYAMIPALAILAWWLNIIVLDRRGASTSRWVAAAAIELVLGYCHPIGFYFVAWIAIAAAFQTFVERRYAAPWVRWLAMQACVATLLIPLPIIALVRDGGTGVIDADRFVSYAGAMIAGWGMTSRVGLALGALLYAAIVVTGLMHARTRAVTIGMLVLPFGLAILVSVTVKPMYKTPVYAAMLLPFACLVLAHGLVAVRGLWAASVAPSLLLMMAALVFPASQILLDRSSPWRPVAADLVRDALPGDVVVVPKPYAYWALLRYAVGPNWGAPLEVMPLQPNADWQRLLSRLSPAAIAALGLAPRTDHVVHRGVTYVIGGDAVQHSRTAAHIWIVERPNYPISVQVAEGFVDKGIVKRYGDRELVSLRLLKRLTPPP